MLSPLFLVRTVQILSMHLARNLLQPYQSICPNLVVYSLLTTEHVQTVFTALSVMHLCCRDAGDVLDGGEDADSSTQASQSRTSLWSDFLQLGIYLYFWLYPFYSTIFQTR